MAPQVINRPLDPDTQTLNTTFPFSQTDQKTHNLGKKICKTCRKLETSETKIFLCSACKVVFYCSKNCQRTDWKIHKKACLSLQNPSFKPSNSLPSKSKTEANEFSTDEKTRLLSKKICTYCGRHRKKNTKLKRCVDCKSVRYCNEACQRNHWKIHKKACKLLKFQDTSRFQALADKKDVIAFLDREDLIPLNHLPKEGLQSISKDVLDRLLIEQDYIPLLKYIRNEPDQDFLIRWLEEQSEQGHPILMLELYRALLTKASHNAYDKETAKTIETAFVWMIKSLAHTHLAMACYQKNMEDPFKSFINICKKIRISSKINQFESIIKKTFSDVNFQIEILKQIDSSRLQPPKWLEYLKEHISHRTHFQKPKHTWKQQQLEAKRRFHFNRKPPHDSHLFLIVNYILQNEDEDSLNCILKQEMTILSKSLSLNEP